jgi:hypothetical protein
MSKTNATNVTPVTSAPPVTVTVAPGVTATPPPVTLRSVLAESRKALRENTRTMTASVNAAVGEEAPAIMRRQARAEIKTRLADKLAPETLTVTLYRDGRGGYEIVEPLDTAHGERIVTGSLRLTDRKTLAASALARLLRAVK